MTSTRSKRPEFDALSTLPLRRDALRWGTLSALGFGLVDWLRLQADGATNPAAPAKSCILIWLDGGPSHLETFDLKPDAPLEVRGPFKPIRTNVPGIDICEHLERTAQLADKFALIRSMTSPLGEHGLAHHYLLTGYKPSPVIEHPSYGSVVAHWRSRDPQLLPPYVTIPDLRAGGAGFLGGRFEPFATGGDPSRPDYRVRDIDLFPDVTPSRLARRREFLQEIDAIQRQVENSPPVADDAMEQAFRLMTSPAAKSAFDLQAESVATRERYGTRMLGQSCLMARRLVERGVPFVSIGHTG
ncbi:MAG: DUF1501 domain-containing protein, partial [Pirellulaceae bacterium]|nr:DUF1501 domain-containing protein [Pirellulaceae bacterium]